jgi:N,N'-diacetylchitobiose transport system permease protein
MPTIAPDAVGLAGDLSAAPDRSPQPGRRRLSVRRRPGLPLLLLLPSLVVLGVVLGYPLFRLVVLSTQEFGMRQQFGAPAKPVGLANYRQVLGDDYFWTVLRRTLAFCVVNVVLTMVIGLLVALLLERLGRRMRLLVSVGLILAWASPALTATVVWQWIFDTQYGLANWLVTTLGIADYQGHSWLSEPGSFFAVATIIVVWMGVPFVAFTLYAGLTQMPAEVVEAAIVDGAGPWQRFRDVTFPLLKPLLLILTALSVLWDFRVFTQIYVLQRAGGINRDTNLIGVYAYRSATGDNRFDLGATIAVIMVVITLLLTVAYLRQMVRQEEL